tara:strand:+ start:354 stop:932 length:579 start_codon:yes stop_codon:yes gene_type:complete
MMQKKIHHKNLMRVVITGAESTGKTKIVRQLSKYFNCPYSLEAARIYGEKKLTPITFNDVESIASLQITLEDKANQRAKTIVIHDTDLISTEIYANYYFNQCPNWIIERSISRSGDLYLICDIDLPWIPDGIRDRENPKERRKLHELFVDTLDKKNKNWVMISGSGTMRINHAISAIEAHINDRHNKNHIKY